LIITGIADRISQPVRDARFCSLDLVSQLGSLGRELGPDLGDLSCSPAPLALPNGETGSV
jgi:hypothetical protein